MEYTVKELAKLSGVTARTLRYYDQIGLLKPLRLTEAGYRIYGPDQVKRLSQILIFKNMGLGLDAIGSLLDDPDCDRIAALNAHLGELKRRRRALDALIATVDKTIAEQKGETMMTDQERFEGLKRQMVEENESKYGEEIRKKYGDEQVEESNARFLGMDQEQFEGLEKLQEKLEMALKEAYATKDPAGEKAMEACELHKQWLMGYGGSYSPEYHRGLGQMYVADPRFRAYYDKIAPGMAVFLQEAIENYCGQ